jgi:hypothetical protein
MEEAGTSESQSTKSDIPENSNLHISHGSVVSNMYCGMLKDWNV